MLIYCMVKPLPHSISCCYKPRWKRCWLESMLDVGDDSWRSNAQDHSYVLSGPQCCQLIFIVLGARWWTSLTRIFINIANIILLFGIDYLILFLNYLLQLSLWLQFSIPSFTFDGVFDLSWDVWVQRHTSVYAIDSMVVGDVHTPICI